MICNNCVYWDAKMCLKGYQPEDEDYCIYFFAEVKWQKQRRQEVLKEVTDMEWKRLNE